MGIVHRRRLWVWRVLAALPALLILDALMGLAYRTNTSAYVETIFPRSGTTHRAFVVFPGYIMPIAFPNLMVVTVQGRNARWHLPLVEFPRETVRAMIATYT